MNAILEFDRADLGYGRRTVLRNVDLVLEAGDFLGIVGPNGAGKTTLLRAMIGTLKPTAGRVHRPAGVRFAYVPQRQFIDEVFPLSAMEVAMMGRYALSGPIARPSRRDRDFVMQCLEHVGIADLATRAYRELSGGQKQRALIARALAAEPHVLILDEPTNDMDIAGEHAIMELIKSLHEQDKLTIVMVSHLLNVLVNYACKLALIDGGLRVVGPTADVLTSENLSGVYEVPVQIAQFGNRKVVLAGGGNA